MVTFFVCLVLLIVGFFTYSKLVEKIFRIDDRPTPAVAHPDGVDYVPMKTWRIFLVQLLNIAGLGPIYGALSGACWGPVVYLWIVFGTILGGGVHDFLSGMMSERNDGKSISEVVGLYMGKVITFIMRVFSVVLLVMVGVNFSVGPAGLLAKLTPDMLGTMFWLVVIMVYYLIATFLPIDKIIGKLYPVFGICLIIMALGIGGAIVLTRGSDMPELTAAAFTVVHPDSLPKWSMMFVTVACGAISGFHATQSPMMARCITSEKQGRTIFYGAMVAEGVIALIWAAAGVTFYTNHGSLLDGMTGLTNAIAAGGAGDVVYQISTTLLGPVGGVLAMIGVIACPITSGDTAYRSARLTIADWFHIDQAKVGCPPPSPIRWASWPPPCSWASSSGGPSSSARTTWPRCTRPRTEFYPPDAGRKYPSRVFFAPPLPGKEGPVRMKFYTPCNNLPFQSVYRVKGGTEMDGPNRLEELVNTYETTLYRAALAILGDAHEAEDAVQDAFLRCLEKAPDFESPAHARAWLLRVTVNGCKSRLRAPWRRRTAPLLDAYPAAAPEEGTLLEAMQALPARDRAVLHLYYYEGYQTAEIAALTGLREGSVRSRLTRARTRLRQVLKGEDE